MYIASITLVELICLKRMMKIINRMATPRCVYFRSFSSFGESMISTQMLVVIAVMAESALEKLAATIPIVKNTTTILPM